MTQKTPSSRRRRSLLTATAVFAVAALGYGVYWATVLRHQESTEDAYVAGHLVQITPEVAGTVTQVTAEDTMQVKAGQLLVALDANDARLAFDRAGHELTQAIREARQLTTQTRQLGAVVAQRQAELNRAEDDLRRRQSLAGTEAVSAEELAHARDAVTAARAALAAAQEQQAANRALTGQDDLARLPSVSRAITRYKEAWLTLARTEIRAPVNGTVARRNVQVGQRVAAGTPMMTVVPLDSVWVDANFKESQLRRLRVGQPVKLEADVYGGDVEYTGRIAGFAAGTGSAFSLLPAQNATGNWIKVVQRVPVRIVLDRNDALKAHPLQVGLSMHAVVDTGAEAKPATMPALSAAARTTPDLKAADAEVARILAAQGVQPHAQ
ncbi:MULTISPECIES: efflux RND transporter periplasmic adaptor subunit [Gulbenkiania]|uniref:Multidrug resistance efflux pump n=1 Tax=Gulbenkiania indica TaxID=375574 RepID=A0A0K6GT12_9NEIS|nr:MULTISPECIES: efflux RND transporter periplasmic adaptor subunit [Gulbenkiania]CUA81865.1 Multidrug resistance efflux pump [Gulbenkiania indica]